MISGSRNQLTRIQAARRLQLSVATIRRLESRGILHPVVDERGVRRFDVEEIERMAIERGLAPESHAQSGSQEALAARVAEVERMQANLAARLDERFALLCMAVEMLIDQRGNR